MSATAISRARRRAPSKAPPGRPPSASVRGWLWALGQVAILGGELFLLLFILAQPVFRATEVRVGGLRHLTSGQIRATLALPVDRTIFFVDPDALAARLGSLPWVRSVQVSLGLPDRVEVSVTEWSPAAVLTRGERSYYLNERGIVLDAADEARGLPVVDPAGSGPVRAGDAALDPELVRMLIALQRGFYSAFHVRVLSFSLDAQQALTLRTDRGFTIIFGQMATGDQRATLTPKLAALRALAARIDLASAPLVYVNLMNPKAPAVLTRSR